MPYGIAIRLGDAPKNLFFDGSAMYRLYPSLGQCDREGSHVVVAVTGRTVDHGYAETTVFKCDDKGQTSPYGGLDHGAEALLPRERIVGRHDHAAALANLSGSGYLIVADDEFDALRASAFASAQAFADQQWGGKPAASREYAEENWGLFAAQSLVGTGARSEPVRSTNAVNWDD